MADYDSSFAGTLDVEGEGTLYEEVQPSFNAFVEITGEGGGDLRQVWVPITPPQPLWD